MAPATKTTTGWVPAKFGHMEAHFPASVASSWGSLKRAGETERVTHHRATLRQYRIAECSAGCHSYCGRWLPLGPGPAVQASSSWSWRWDPPVESLHADVIQVGRFEAFPAFAISLKQIPGNLVRCHGFGYAL